MRAMANPVFDLLATLVGTHLPDARALLHRARLFDFPYRAHEVLPKTFQPGERELIHEHFFLPFEIVAVEDTASLVVLMNTEPEQRGLPGRRHFIECLPMRVGDDAEFRPEEREIIQKHQAFFASAPERSATVTMGYIEQMRFEPDGNILFNGALDLAVFATPERILMNLVSEWHRTQQYKQAVGLAQRERGALREREEIEFREATLRNVAVAMQEVMYFNTPNRFIVERTPKSYWRYEDRLRARKRRKQDPTKRPVLRSDARPTYILLTPEEIRTQFHFPTPTGGTKRAHERRRHFRTYPNDPARWPNAAGRTVVVPATWVGPSERQTKDTRYRVLLDV